MKHRLPVGENVLFSVVAVNQHSDFEALLKPIHYYYNTRWCSFGICIRFSAIAVLMLK